MVLKNVKVPMGGVYSNIEKKKSKKEQGKWSDKQMLRGGLSQISGLLKGGL